MKKSIITGIIAAHILIAGSFSALAQTQPPENATVTKAKGIVLPDFKLDKVTFTEAIRQLSIAAKQNDPAKRVNFVITDGAQLDTHARFSVDLKNVTLLEAAERLAQSAGAFATAEDFAIVFRPKTDLGTVGLPAGKWTQFDLGAGKRCRIFATQLPPASIHLKAEILSPDAAGTDVIQSLRELTVPLGQPTDIRLGDTMVSLTPKSTAL